MGVIRGVSGLLGGVLGLVSGLLRGVLGLVLALLAAVLLIVAAVLCVTILLLPLGVPLGAFALRLLGQAVQLILPGSSGVERRIRSFESALLGRRNGLRRLRLKS